MGLIERLRQRGKELSNEQKVAFVLLVFFGLGGVVLGFRSFGAMIRRPFEIQIADATSERFLTSSEKESAEIEAQKTRDTDKDGLSDYDELNVFKTSPYLSDSDSDGFDDKTETYSGHDPNCPEGKSCGRGVISSADAVGSSTAASGLISSLAPFGVNFSNQQFSSEAEIQAYLKSITVDEIRKALVDAGLSQQQVDALSDVELQKLFDGVVGQASANGELSALLQAQTGTETTSTDTTSQP